MHPLAKDKAVSKRLEALFNAMPGEIAATFTLEQQLHLDEALRKNNAKMPVKYQGLLSIPFTTHRFFWVFLAGRDKRELTRSEQNVSKWAVVSFIFLVISISTLIGLLVLYLIKSAMGINLFEHFSLGIWGWFKQNFL